MITLPRLLNSALLLASLISATAAFAETTYCPKSFDVLVNKKKNHYDFEKKELAKLFCNNSFEGEHFKVVYGTEDKAISFDSQNEAVRKKAANVYYHLMMARDFWIKEMKSDFVSKLPQIVVRIDITNAFSSARHFKNAELEKNYNNAWSIPEGETPRFVKDKIKWGKEIWFSPSKKIESRKEIVSEGNNPVHESLELVKDPIVEMNKNALIYTGLNLTASPELYSGTVLNNALKNVATIAIIYGLLEVTKHMDKWFVEKYYFVDTAMIPDVIYHEYAHIALSDTMKTTHSVPVIEGFADYFATRVADRTKMYKGIKGFSQNRSKNANNNSLYHPFYEASWNASSDFVLSLLWLGKKQFEELNKFRAERGQDPIVNYDDLVLQTHYHVTEQSDIANDLNTGLIEACKEKCSSLRVGVNTLNEVFEMKGFN